MKKNRLAQCEAKKRIWEDHLREWRSSGLSQAEYCRRNGLSVKSFGYHKRTHASTAVSLIEVPMPVRSGPLHLHIGQLYRIEIERGFDAQTLHQILLVLEGV
jgi:hypothetical protein